MSSHGDGLARLASTLEREARHAAGRNRRMFPHFSERGRWSLLAADETSRWRGEEYDHGNWTLGFWFGVIWLAAELTGSSAPLELARARLDLVRPRAHDSTTHDLGFIFWPSLVFGHRLGFVADEETEPALVAAGTLARRFNPQGGYIQAFGAIGHSLGAGTSTIDTMMNLPLLWWAGTMKDQKRLLEIAHQHALTSKATFLRDDWSTYHLNRFDPRSGVLLRQETFQGASPSSCWSRGQAWAICGFALAYAATSDSEMLTAAEQTAEYFWAHLPPSGLPPWDFTETAVDAPQDASAAAIAGFGALVLAELHPAEDRRACHRSRAEEVLGKLMQYVPDAEDVDGILQHCSYSVPHRLGMDGATAWGDFYFSLAYTVLAGRIPTRLVLDGPSSASTDGRVR